MERARSEVEVEVDVEGRGNLVRIEIVVFDEFD